ncbi:hypothetical protein Q5752_006085 [Cryptotrichosporon argae]
MFKKLSSAVGSLTGAPAALPADHHDPARARAYVGIAQSLNAADIPTSLADCAACNAPCADDEAGPGAGTLAEVGNAWNGKTYADYVAEKYGDLGALPAGFDTDWESDLVGSGGAPSGRVVIVSTGKSDWERDHVDEKDGFPHKLNKYIESIFSGGGKGPKADASNPASAVSASQFPPPSATLNAPISVPPSLFSSSLLTQSDDPEDQTALVFPDWKVTLEVENSAAGAKALWDGALAGTLGRAGRALAGAGAGVERRRSYVLPYRALVLLCSHKRRDKRCHIAAPLLRAALHTCLEKHGIAVDEMGEALAALDGPPLEEVAGTDAEREAAVGKRIEAIEGVHGGPGGQVGIFDINHLGGHRYAGVMLILFPSGAYLSYGRVTPQEIPRVVEDTIVGGKVVPGLLRNGSGLARPGASAKECGFLGW